MSDTATSTLNKFQANIYSQNGEDGIIREILKRLGIGYDRTQWCVEFGAWDGIHMSNSFALVEKGWNAIYIEGDKDRFRDLEETCRKHTRIVSINAFVARYGNEENALDKLLEKTEIPEDFALLSIDIDSYDLDVWESLTGYAPKIVIIEIDSGILPGIVQRHSSRAAGCSFSAALNVAKHKNYTLVCHTGNCIFVRNDLVEKLGLDSRFIHYPELLFLYDAPWLPEKKPLARAGLLERLFRRLKSLKRAME